jgi:AcrR family transcriptional regulator
VAPAQIDRIARAAGVVRGTFYFHFPSKDDVLFELKHRMEYQALTRLRDFRHTEIPLSEYLLRLADALIETTSSVGSIELLRESLSLYMRRPDSEPLEEMSLDEEVALRIAAAQKRGELRQDLSADQIAVLFLTSTFGFFGQLEGEELRTALYSLVGIVAKGISA